MAALQDRHWWYRGRRMLVDQLLSQHLSVAGTPARLLEIGAGTGSNLQVLSAHGSVTAVEPAPYAAACIESAHPDVAAVRQFWVATDDEPLLLPGEERVPVAASAPAPRRIIFDDTDVSEDGLEVPDFLR